MNTAALQELHSCEYGSFEDNILHDATRLNEYADGLLHIVEIIERSPWRTRVDLQNQDEVDEFFAQTVTGTFGLYCPGIGQRIFDELEPLCSDKVPAWIRRGYNPN
jgi:hypothetical protein